MKKVILFLGSVVVLAACDRTPTAPVKLAVKSANDVCVWYKDGNDSTLVCTPDPK